MRKTLNVEWQLVELKSGRRIAGRETIDDQKDLTVAVGVDQNDENARDICAKHKDELDLQHYAQERMRVSCADLWGTVAKWVEGRWKNCHKFVTAIVEGILVWVTAKCQLIYYPCGISCNKQLDGLGRGRRRMGPTRFIVQCKVSATICIEVNSAASQATLSLSRTVVQSAACPR